MNTFIGAFNWYGFLIASGMIIDIVIAYFLARKRGYYSDLVFDIVIISIPMAIIGARLYYIIFDVIGGGSEWSDWSFKRIIGLEGGLAGLAIYGGLIGAVCGGAIVAALQKRRKENQRVSFLQMADLAFTVIILGQAIGRWGNFANGEAYGLEITNPSLQWFPIAVNIDGVYHMATFFYESLWDLIGFFILLWLYNGRRKSFDGFVLYSYCIWYGVGRAVIEGWRTDSLWLIENVVRVSQLLSIILIVFGAVMIIAHTYRARTRGLRPFILVPVDKLDYSYFGYDKSQLSKPPMEDPKKKKAEAETPDVDLYENLDDIAEDLNEKSTADGRDSIRDIAGNVGASDGGDDDGEPAEQLKDGKEE